MRWCVSFSLLRSAGVIPESIGQKSEGVGRMLPVINLIVSLRATSIFLVCALRQQNEAEYSAAIYTRSSLLVRKVEVLAPHDDPARRLIDCFGKIV